MAYVVRKIFDWQEDLKNYKFPPMPRGLSNSHRFHKKLSWKGRLRKLFCIKKPKEIKP